MAKVEVLNIDTSQATSSIKALRQQLKELKDQMAGLEEGSEEFLKVAASAGEVKHQIDEIQQSVNGASADFGDMLSSATGALNGIIGGFTAAQGVMNLFGIESEATVEAMKKLQALMAIGQGIAQIDNGIKAFKKFAKAIETTETYQKLFNKTQLQGVAITKQDTAATNAGTVAKNASAAATKILTNATKAFSAVLKGIGIGALIAAVSLLVEGLKQLATWFRNNFDETTKFQKKIENAKTVLDALETSLTRQQGYNKFTNELIAAGFVVDDLANKINNFNGTFQKMIENERMFAEEATLSSILQATDDFKEYEKTLTGISDVLNELGQTDKYKYIGENIETSLKQFDILRKIKGPIDQGTAIKLSSMSEVTSTQINGEIQELEKTIFKQEALLQKDGLASGLRKEVEKRLENNKLTIKQLTNASEYYRALTIDVYDYAKKHNEELLKQLELERELKINSAEIYKIQIDTNAKTDESYAESAKYLDDQLKYHYQILETQQKGSKEYEKTISEIQIINYQLGEADRVTQDILTRLSGYKGINETLAEDAFETQEEIDEEINNMLENWQKAKEAAQAYYEQIRESGLSDELYFYEQQNRKLAALEDYHKKGLISEEQYQDAIQTLQKHTTQYHIQQSVQAAGFVADTLQSLAESMDQNDKKQFESAKKLQIAAATINTISGITAALSGLFTTKTGPWDIVLASLQAASIAAAGYANIQQIRRQSFDGSSSLNASSINSTLVAPTQYTQAVQNANIESKLGDTRVYVLESDINKTVQRVSVQESENTY